MPFDTGFRGHIGGSVQANYTDQPGVGAPGMLAFASDVNLCDAVYVGEPDGIAAGCGVVFVDVVNDASLQRPNVAAELPDNATVVADFKGIVVFDEQMQSDSDGVPGWANGRMGRILRNNRNGGRVYVAAREAVDHTTDSVNLVIVAGTDGLYKVGEFAPIALAGTGLAGTSILISTAKWATSAVVGDVAMIELLG